MILVGCAVFLWALALFGLGRWGLLLAGRSPGLRTPGAAGVVGVAFAQVLATLWNFRFAISPALSAILLVIGLCGHALNGRRLGPRVSRGFVGTLAAVSALIAPWLMSRVHALHDVGFYQLPTVLWSQRGAIPLGLANLNPRMGFNSSWFVLDALLRRPLLPADSLPSPAAAIIASMVIACGLGVLRGMPRPRAARLLALCVLAACLALGTATAVNGLNSPATDLPVVIAWVVAGLLVLSSTATGRDHDATVLLSALVAAMATTTKLSAAPMALVGMVFAWRARVPARTVLTALALASAVIGPWLARGFWTSGCGFFPLEASCLPSAWWSTPRAMVHAEAVNVLNWARQPYWSDAGTVRADWIVPWAARLVLNAEAQVPVIVAAIALAVGTSVRPIGAGPAVALASGVVGQVLLIMAGAPDPRFFMGALWVSAWALAWRSLRDVSVRRWAVFASVVLALSAPALLQGWRDQTRGLRHVGQAPAVWLTPPRLNAAVPFHWQTVDGVRVRVPEPTPPLTAACWALDPPCTSYPLDGVHFRSSADGSHLVAIVRQPTR